MRPETARALGVLLLYPTPELRDALPEIGSILSAEENLSPERRRELAALLDELANRDLLDLEESYTALFDRGTSLSLYLFEHVYGEGRERGGAMVELIELYRREGLTLAVADLPDYLPILCEFLSVARPKAAAEMLAGVAAILALLRRRLVQRQSSYAAVPAALCDLAGGVIVEPDSPETPEPVTDAEQDLAAIDRAWEEAPVTFGAQDSAPPRRGSS